MSLELHPAPHVARISSQVAAQAFASNGHQNVYNLVGGIDAWSTEIDPQVPRY